MSETAKTDAVGYRELLPAVAAGRVGEVTFVLSHPIQGEGGDDIAELRLCEPTARQLEILDGPEGELAKTKKLIAALNGMAPPLLNAMRGRDLVAMSALVSAFLGVVPPTGGT